MPSDVTAKSFLEWFCLWCLPTFMIAGAAAWLLNIPALRVERARLFLDLLSLGLRTGRSPEQAIIDLSGTRDRSLGARFHLLGAWIRSGLRFADALRRSPSLIPSRISAMLIAGDLAGVLPGALQAARRGATLPDAQARAALSCQIIMLFILNPLILAALPFFLLKIFPVLNAISAGVGRPTPVALAWVVHYSSALFLSQAVSILLLYLAAIFYVGGNRFTRWLEAGLFPLSAWIALKIPWKRKRLHRDFSAMLALLLDVGIPEAKALKMAGSSTSNEIFEGRVNQAIEEIKNGKTLILALEILDPPREFAWRLANALQRKGEFSAALQGWFDALDAEADAQEQTAGDVLSTGLLLINGVVVGFIIAAVMQVIYSFSM